MVRRLRLVPGVPSPSLTVAPGGGLNENTESDGACGSNDVKPTSNAGVCEPRGNTCTRVGMWVAPSMAILTVPTRVEVSLGSSTSWYAARPATTAVGRCVTLVVGVIAFRAWSAACWGVIGASRAGGSTVGRVRRVRGLAGTVKCLAVLALLDQSHTSEPLRMRSDSPRSPSSASRAFVGPAYQRRSVCDPDTREVKSELDRPPMFGRAGSPRSAVCTTVPDRPSTWAFWTSTRSWDALRGASESRALALMAAIAAPAVPSSTAATSGTSQRSDGTAGEDGHAHHRAPGVL